MSELTTVPTFTFNQGDPFSGTDERVEYPIQVKYYMDVISLEQDGRNINLTYDHFEKLFKEIKKHLPEAEKKLKQK